MGFFDKKYCDICGDKIGLLGNRKLSDGNMCKPCTKLLSPYFSDRRQSSVQDIKDQLAYREENERRVQEFNVTRTLGMGTKVLLDEDAGNFLVSKSSRWREENPDILAFSQVTGCNIDIEESKEELTYLNEKAEKTSYNPKRYYYEYDFFIAIHVNSPWFDEIRFRVNNSSIEVEVPPMHFMIEGGPEVGRRSIEYRECEALAEEIQSALTKVRVETRESIQQANIPQEARKCPHCQATTTPDANGCCEYCGGAMGIS